MRKAGLRSFGRWVETIRFALGRDRQEIGRFIRSSHLECSLAARLRLLGRLAWVTDNVRGYHGNGEMLRVGAAILGRSPPVVIEAGCGYGASTAKLSWFVAEAGGELWVFDSFRGIPDNDEVHQNLDGRRVLFKKGAFRGRERAVQRTVETYGRAEVCRWVKGDFADTLHEAPVADVILLDVDLVRSTRTCVRELFPRLRRGGVMFSQDGHLKATVDLLGNAEFWRAEVGTSQPVIAGLGSAKLLEWTKR